MQSCCCGNFESCITPAELSNMNYDSPGIASSIAYLTFDIAYTGTAAIQIWLVLKATQDISLQASLKCTGPNDQNKSQYAYIRSESSSHCPQAVCAVSCTVPDTWLTHVAYTQRTGTQCRNSNTRTVHTLECGNMVPVSRFFKWISFSTLRSLSNACPTRKVSGPTNCSTCC